MDGFIFIAKTHRFPTLRYCSCRCRWPAVAGTRQTGFALSLRWRPSELVLLPRQRIEVIIGTREGERSGYSH